MKKRSISILLAGICFVVTLVAPSLNAHSAVPPKPDMFVWVSLEVGSSVYVQYAAVGEGLLKKFGIKLRVVPAATDFGRVILVRTRQADCFALAAAIPFAWKGSEDFADRSWGPQPIRTVWLAGRQYPSSVVTRKGTGIETLADLKGKRVPKYVGSPGFHSLMTANLAFANLTWDDVTSVEVGGYVEAITLMMAHKLDVCYADAMSAKAVELASSPAGLIWIPMPKEDVEGWKRYRKISPVFYPIQPKYGINVPADNTTWMATSAWPTVYTYDFADEKKIYWMTKAIAESFPEYKDMLKPSMQWWAPEMFTSIEALVPYHPGTVRYLKEAGLWTDAMEKRNALLLEREKQVQAAWEKATLEAGERKMKDKDFPVFWLKQLEALEKKWD